MKLIENYKKRHEFNAENCRARQQAVIDSDYERKLSDIKGRIRYVVENSTDEHAVIYSVKPYERDMFERLTDYFEEKGFYAVITSVSNLQGEYFIISW